MSRSAATVADYAKQSATRLRSRLPAALATDDHAVDDLTTAILALSNGLAIERMIDRDAVNPALAGRLLLAAARTDDDTHTHQ